MRAIVSTPSGFSDREDYKSEVTVAGYTWGFHQDAVRYDRGGETVLAVVIFDTGRFGAVPITWLSAKGEVQN